MLQPDSTFNVVRAAYNMFDPDNKGHISAEDLGRVCNQLGYSVDKHDLDNMLSVLAPLPNWHGDALYSLAPSLTGTVTVSSNPSLTGTVTVSSNSSLTGTVTVSSNSSLTGTVTVLDARRSFGEAVSIGNWLYSVSAISVPSQERRSSQRAVSRSAFIKGFCERSCPSANIGQKTLAMRLINRR